MNESRLYLDESESFQKRAEDLVSRMTLEEKVSQMRHEAPGIPRLGVPEYNWWSENLHGVGRAGTATVFPQPIGMAATFTEDLLEHVGCAIADEARAKYRTAQEVDDHDTGKGLTFWAPNVNIFRDPRWGRGHETYGEDPYLAGRLGTRFVRGVQGDGKYLKTAAGAKHFAAHSGPEADRHAFDARVSEKDLRETYLPAFEACVREGKVEAVMGAYNRLNGEPCCGSRVLLRKILRDEWVFKGHVTSDCWGIRDFHEHHGVTKTPAESVALAVEAGCDLNCGDMYPHIVDAVREGLLDESRVDESVTRLMLTRFRLGMFDEGGGNYLNTDPYDVIANADHRALALEVARRSLVLLKNDGVLPLHPARLQTLAVIGPNADSRLALLGNYNGTPLVHVTVLEGIRRRVGEEVRILYSEGCHLFEDKVEPLAGSNDRLSEAVSMARRADVVVLCLGLDATIEGEQGDISNAYGSGDKPDLALPGKQRGLLDALLAVGKPVVVISMSGSALWLDAAQDAAAAVIQAWYPGGEGGQAVAELLFGDFSPSGRLPVTFYSEQDELPDFEDYSMAGRTYKFMANEALFPFGYGLSYTHFAYSEIVLEGATATVTVENVGDCDGWEMVQLYVEKVERAFGTARWQLRGIRNVYLKCGEKADVTFPIQTGDLSFVNADGEAAVEPGTYHIHVGGGQPDTRTAVLTGETVGFAKLVVESGRAN